MLWALVTVLAIGVAVAGLVVLRAVRGLLEQRLGGIADTLDRRLGELDTKVDRRLEGLDGRLLLTQQSAGETATRIAEKLGRVEGATAQMLQRANDLARLEHALRPPKARGGFGEILLGNLLRDRLPAGAYALQHGFSTGERVDAVVRVEKLVPIDAKFPLDNFERLVEAESDEARSLHEKAFARDLKGHVDSIASKYIRPAEGTYDFALMYLPSEAVYYELVCGKTGALLSYAHEKRVFPVSPTTFTAQLQVIALGLKGLQIEQHAQEVMAYCAQLQKDLGRFKEDFDLVGTHLGRAQTKFGEAERRLTRLETKLEQATEEAAPALDAQTLPRALDAA
jgi:DNA recombination protein RmuC